MTNGPPMQDKIVIIGGGIGGLAAALALVRRGIDVAVYEQAHELRELGAGVQISPNGTRVLHALGLKGALEHVQVLPTGKIIRLWNTGQSFRLFEVGMESVKRYGSPYITIHRGDLQVCSPEHCLPQNPGRFTWATAARAGANAGSGQIRFESGAPVTAKLVIGADGLHSVVRESLFGDANRNSAA